MASSHETGAKCPDALGADAPQRAGQPHGGIEPFVVVAGRALDAERAAAHRVVGIAAHLGDLAVADPDGDAAGVVAVARAGRQDDLGRVCHRAPLPADDRNRATLRRPGAPVNVRPLSSRLGARSRSADPAADAPEHPRRQRRRRRPMRGDGGGAVLIGGEPGGGKITGCPDWPAAEIAPHVRAPAGGGPAPYAGGGSSGTAPGPRFYHTECRNR